MSGNLDLIQQISKFYMRLNEDGKQFAPWISFSWNWRNRWWSQREERFDVLVEK
jgi:hypothetical protein